MGGPAPSKFDAAGISPSRAERRRLPLPRWVVERCLGEAAIALYLQMAAYAYRRVSTAHAIWRFHWARLLAFPLIFPATYLYIDSYDLALRAKLPSLVPACGAILFVAFFIPACGIAMPSPFPSWLANTARRGFLRDLSLSQLTAAEVAHAHALARIVPTTVFAFCMAELFLAMALAEHLLGKQNMTYYMTLHLCCLVILAGSVLQECGSYGIAARSGTSIVWWLVGGFVQALPGALILTLLSWIVTLVVGYWISEHAPLRLGLREFWSSAALGLVAPLTLLSSLAFGLLFFRRGVAELAENWSSVVEQANAARGASE